MKLAKENDVTVLLDGQGADELLAGYYSFQKYFLKELKTKNIRKFEEEKELLLKNFKGYHKTKKQGVLASIIPQRLINYTKNKKNKFHSLSSVYLQQFTKNMFEEFRGKKANTNSFNTLNQSLKHQINNGLTDLLRYADRNSMAHSREVRLPFLNHKLVEFLFSIDSNYKIRNGWSKFILRNSIENIVPEKIVWRKDKIGFAPPKSNEISDNLVQKSIDTLIKNDILRKEKIIKNEAWKYYQVAKVFDNN